MALVTGPVSTCRVATWTARSVRLLRADLVDDGLEAISRLTEPPAARERHRTIVVGTLWCVRTSCLVRAAVLQRWDAEHGVRRSLHIGVRRADGGVEAHAWLDGDRVDAGFSELHRRPAPNPG
ncbi:MAG TPA: lasso peptide biosynthesis B2 protein [Acidimicrobiales bacterium]|nr:lasso peptide biosynthesis B2 protein [Acidimicrobiales bacterium]